MKTFRLTFIMLLLLGTLSCRKTDNGASATVTTDQAADMIAGSLAINSDGIATVTDDIAVNAQTVSSIDGGSKAVDAVGTSSVHHECGSTWTDSITRAGTSASVSYNYFFKYSHTLNCNTNGHPDNLVNALTFHGNFDGPRISSEGSGTANATIAGLTATATSFVVNGEYKRKGSFQSKVGNKASGSSDIDIVVTNLTLTKPGRKISGGTAVISVSGTWKKGSFSYNGIVLFNGDGTATVTINGKVYIVDLQNGVTTIK